MFAKKLKCTVTENTLISPSVIRIRFSTPRKLNFEPGQFISVQVNRPNEKKDWRCYSLANAPQQASAFGYELCIKRVKGGKGTTYMESLKVGDSFQAKGPFGIFKFHKPQPGRNVVFIAAGSGIAPIRSILHSKEFQENKPQNSVLLYGAQNETEILYRNEFIESGVESVYALSKPNYNWLGFEGRVTDILRKLPKDWDWHTTDFYVAGPGEMVKDVLRILLGGHGINKSQVYFEAFSTPSRDKRKTDRSSLPIELIKAVA